MKRLIGVTSVRRVVSVSFFIIIGEYGIRPPMNHEICVKYFEITVQKFAPI